MSRVGEVVEPYSGNVSDIWDMPRGIRGALGTCSGCVRNVFKLCPGNVHSAETSEVVVFRSHRL